MGCDLPCKHLLALPGHQRPSHLTPSAAAAQGWDSSSAATILQVSTPLKPITISLQSKVAQQQMRAAAQELGKASKSSDAGLGAGCGGWGEGRVGLRVGPFKNTVLVPDAARFGAMKLRSELALTGEYLCFSEN